MSSKPVMTLHNFNCGTRLAPNQTPEPWKEAHLDTWITSNIMEHDGTTVSAREENKNGVSRVRMDHIPSHIHPHRPCQLAPRAWTEFGRMRLLPQYRRLAPNFAPNSWEPASTQCRFRGHLRWVIFFSGFVVRRASSLHHFGERCTVANHFCSSTSCNANHPILPKEEIRKAILINAHETCGLSKKTFSVVENETLNFFPEPQIGRRPRLSRASTERMPNTRVNPLSPPFLVPSVST